VTAGKLTTKAGVHIDKLSLQKARKYFSKPKWQ